MASSGGDEIWVKVRGRCALVYYRQSFKYVAELLVEVERREKLNVGAGLLTIFPSEADATTPEKACLACSVVLAVVVNVIEFSH